MNEHIDRLTLMAREDDTKWDLSPNDRAAIRFAIDALESALARVDRIRHLAAVLCNAINRDDEHEIDEATVRALVALRLAISPDGAVAHLALSVGPGKEG